ncbi:MAG TPA: nucleoside-triphosphatase [Anaerolineae bacterium]|nr:nucleoside-triphosphatase [Anaerolineae bacterium]
MGARVGLLTGPVGVGKTTVAERVIGLAMRQGLECAGLLAPAMLNRCGQKAGIWGVDVRTGERRILARTDRDLDGPSIGPYSFDGTALSWATGLVEAACTAPDPADPRSCDLLVVDEIGKLELWRGIGLAPVLPRLAAGQVHRSLIVVRDSLLAELQARLGSVDQVVFQVREENRGTLAPHILKSLL